MSDRELTDYLVLREIDPPVSHAERERASERSIAALDTVRGTGTGIEWVRSEIMTDEDDRVTGTLCHFRAETEEALYENADSAGIPASQVFRRGSPADGPDR